MSEPRRWGRSVGALFAGFLVVVILSVGTDAVMRATGVFPPLGQLMADPLLLLATVYRTIYSVVGSYIAARLAPDRPILHALWLGAAGFVVSVVGAVTTWNRGGAFGPHWYPVALIVIALPCAWIGGKIRDLQVRAHADR